MNINQHKVKLLNASGKPREIGEIPDLWHIAEGVRNQAGGKAGDAVLEVWHMAHDMKDAITNQDQARVIDVSDRDDDEIATDETRSNGPRL